MKLLKDWGLALAVGLAVFLLAEWISHRSNVPPGQAAPLFELVNVDGGTVKLADLQGKTVVLNFWGTWCPPCRQEIPEFAEFATEHPDVTILGIASDSGEGAVLKRAAVALGVNYTVLESTPQVLAAYGIDAYPTTVVVAADGTVGAVRTGMIGKSTLEAVVEDVSGR